MYLPSRVDEVHGDVEQIVDIALEPEAVLEDEGQDAAAVGIGVRPDMAAVAEEAVGLAQLERRVGPESGRDRLQREADPEHLDHRRFRVEVEIDLDRAGGLHHLQAHGPDLGHVFAHDLVAALGHPRHVGKRPFRIVAETEEADVHFAGDFLHLVQVLVHLATGLVDVLKGGAGKLDLAGRFEGDAAAVLHGQGDDVVLLVDGGPAEADKAFEQGANSPLALVFEGTEIIQAIGELLVFGADPPVFLRLAPLFQVLQELALVGDRRGGTAFGHG